MVARGMREPLLIVTDGNPGVLKAIAEVFPRSLKQRCQKHRLENILGKAPKEVRDELKAAILESFHANSYEQGLKKGREVIARYRQRFPSAMKCMEETLEACLQALRLPRLVKILERPAGQQYAPFQGPLESVMRLGSTSATIITRGIIKARRICCCSQPADQQSSGPRVLSSDP